MKTSMQHDLLLTLLRSISGGVLSNWLSIKDRVRLDTSFCSKNGREQYLALNASLDSALKSRLYNEYNFIEASDVLIPWAKARRVLVERLCIGSDSDLSMYEAYLAEHGHGVLEIQVGSSLSRAVSCAALCSNLLRLDCRSSEISASLREVLTSCRKLKELRFDYRYAAVSEIPPTSLTQADLIGLTCPSLRHLSIESCQDAGVVEQMLKLAVNVEVFNLSYCTTSTEEGTDVLCHISPTVSSLALCRIIFTEESLSAVVQRCSNIVHLDMSETTISPSMATMIGTHLKKLQSLNFSGSKIEDDVLYALGDTCGDTLTELMMCHSKDLSVDAVNHTLMRFKKLTTMGMHFSDSNENDIDFTLFGQITTLFALYAGEFGGEFVRNISNACPNLQHFHVFIDDPKGRASMINGLVHKCTMLQTLHVEVDSEQYETGDFHDPMDIARWRKFRPNLVTGTVFSPSEFCIRRALPTDLSEFGTDS